MTESVPPDSGGEHPAIWGTLKGRERHVLPEADGSVLAPRWLHGLAFQRALLADEIPRILAGERGGHMSRRGRAIAVAAVRQGAGFAVVDRPWVRGDVDGSRAAAKRARLLFESLGPTFIKLGQIVSGGPGLFPDELVEEFASCRDAVPPVRWEQARQVLAEDLPGGADVFARIDREPFAAASIAQVHHATLHDGREVVVKIQRPGLARRVRADLELLAMFSRAGLRFSRALEAANPLAVVEYAAETLLEELDFRLEAENQLDVGEAVRRSEVHDGVAVPRPHPVLVTRRVLTMERLHGFPFSESQAALDAGIDTVAMLRAGMSCFLEGAMVHGVFHGDLHGGNVLVCHDGRYGILDYGIVGRLSPAERRAFASMMAGIVTGDIEAQIVAMQEMGALPADVDPAVIAAEVPHLPFFELRMPNAAEIAEMMKGMVHTLLRLQFRLPKLLVLLAKNLIFLDDTISRYAPGFDLAAEAGTAFQKMALVTREMDPSADSTPLPRVR
jgi:ubiquinone biosynthesis protein